MLPSSLSAILPTDLPVTAQLYISPEPLVPTFCNLETMLGIFKLLMSHGGALALLKETRRPAGRSFQRFVYFTVTSFMQLKLIETFPPS